MVAYVVRAQQHVDDQNGFRQALGENAMDLGLTYITFGLVGGPASIVEGGATVTLADGATQVFAQGLSEGAPAWQVGALRVGSATPDMAGLSTDLIKGQKRTDC